MSDPRAGTAPGQHTPSSVAHQDLQQQQQQPLGQQAAARPESTAVNYVCGNCGAEVALRQGDAVMCRSCTVQHRILYKKRTRNIVQFEVIQLALLLSGFQEECG